MALTLEVTNFNILIKIIIIMQLLKKNIFNQINFFSKYQLFVAMNE